MTAVASLVPSADVSTMHRGDVSTMHRGDVSPRAALNASPAGDDDRCVVEVLGDVSSTARANRSCAWCRRSLEATARRDARFCSRRCRQAAFRLHRRRATDERAARPLRLAYADPPYPGRARRYYGDQPTYAGEVDHAALIASLTTSYDGWALSTSADALRALLPLCPPAARVCAWVKPIGVPQATYGLHNTWEPLIVMQARRLQPGRRDWLRAMPARGGGDLPGRKPLAFVAWLFDSLGALPGDTIDDLYPGTGIVGRAWDELSRKAFGDASRSAEGDAFQPGVDDASGEYFDDASSAEASP